VSVEYSPLAHLVGNVKLRWSELSPGRLRRRASDLARYTTSKSARPPALAAFANPEIFDVRVLHGLLSAREAIRAARLSSLERAFFLLGLAAVVEDLSGAMKDGRALRILRGRARRRTSLARLDHAGRGGEAVRRALEQQWAEMISDLEALAVHRAGPRVATSHIRGDARELAALQLPGGSDAFPPGGVGLFAYSPPYLNCIDYSEIYKLELWLLELVRDQTEFRDLRLGTLRSHPRSTPRAGGIWRRSPRRRSPRTSSASASFIERHHVRAGIGRIVRDYFDDMFRALSEQCAALEPGGFAVCVVGNSTFSRRETTRAGA